MSCSRLSWLWTATSIVAQPVDEDIAGVDAVGFAAVGVAAPLDEDRREILVGLPVARVDQLLDAGAVGARLGAEDAIAGARLDLVERGIRRPRTSSR